MHGRFPGLADGALYEGRDLPVTTDFRAVFCELAGKHLGIADDGRLFPGWTGGRLPLLRAEPPLSGTTLAALHHP